MVVLFNFTTLNLTSLGTQEVKYLELEYEISYTCNHRTPPLKQEEVGIEPLTFWLVDDPLYLLTHSCPVHPFTAKIYHLLMASSSATMLHSHFTDI